MKDDSPKNTPPANAPKSGGEAIVSDSESKKDDNVPLKQKLCFGVGAVTDIMGLNAPKELANPIYNVALGLNPAYIGISLAITRVWDAIIDPVVGSMSDNSRSRFGRRKPYLAAGAVACFLSFPALWFVPASLGPTGLFLYLTFGLLIFYACYTFFAVPYHALGYEMAVDYHDRSRLMGYRLVFNAVGGIMFSWVYLITQLDVFDNTLQGMKFVGIAVGVLFLVFGLIPAIFVKERVKDLAAKQEKISLLRSLKTAIKFKPFVALIVSMLMMVSANNMVRGLGFYVNVYHVHHGDTKAASILVGWVGTAQAIASIVSIPVVAYISTKIGKHRTILYVGVFFLLIGSVLKWFCYTPNYPYLQLVPIVFLGASLQGFWVMTHSMLSDICDFDELETGMRREGMFGSVLTWFQKLGFSLSFLLSGFILVWTGFDVELGGNQSEKSLLWMRIAFSVIPIVFGLLLWYLINRYTISESDVRNVRTELEKRRGAY